MSLVYLFIAFLLLILFGMLYSEVIAVSVSDLVASWLQTRSVTLAPSTVSGYRRLHRLYVAGTRVGRLPIDELNGSDMVELLKPLIDRGCTRQAQLLQVLVSAALKSAIKRRRLYFNPMDEIDHVKHKSVSTAWLRPDQARQLLASSAEANDPYFIAWLLMLCCGLRRSEVLALKWSDIDEARQLLHVQRQRIVVDGVELITRPKSLSSVRDIPLDDHVLTLLRLHAGPNDDILGGVSHKMLADALDRALLRAQLPRVTLHGLRHSMAAVAAGDGIPVKILQGLLGHAHYQTTADIYAHVDQAPRIEAVHLITKSLLGTRLEIV